MNTEETKRSFNQEKSQLFNRSLVLDLIRQQGICSRVTLSQLSGLKQTTITNIINEFIGYDLVVETGLMSGSKGRRSIGLKLNDDQYKVIGVRMTRMSFYICLFGLSGQIYGISQYTIPHNERVEETIARIRTAIQIFLNKNSDCEIPAIAMAMPGPYRADIDRLLFVTELVGWQNYPIKEALAKDLSIPVYIVNDANASAFAQLWYRSKKSEIKNMIYVLAGQGIGCGMIADGKLVDGDGGIAGEFGHNTINFNGPKCECGNHGCLEKYCSSLVFCENIKKRLQAGEQSVLTIDNLTGVKISEAVQSRDTVAREEYIKVCAFLSIGIVNLINQFNPGLIVIGDELTQIAPDLLLSIVQKKIYECINPLVLNDLTIEINQLTESPCLLGAGAIAAQNAIADLSKLMNQSK
nr:ROK family protein [uncultured Caproiciproducens sp.]